MSPHIESVQQHIQRVFPNVFYVPLPDAARFIGVSQKTVRNKIWRGEPLFPTVERGGRRFVTIDDLARFVAAELDAQIPVSSPSPIPTTAEEPIKRSRGRPRKLSAAKQ